jgi:hypothetical protein
VAQQLHQQPARVAAGAARRAQRFLRRLDAGLHADQIADVLRHALVEGDQEIHRRHRRRIFPTGYRVQVALEARRQRAACEVGRQFLQQVRFVAERELAGARLEKEFERVDDRHLGHQVDLDLQLPHRLGEHQARQPVRLRVLLPVEEVIRRRDALGIGKNRSARVRRGPQAHHLRPEHDRPVVAVMRDMT